jgi:hypothetical protein
MSFVEAIAQTLTEVAKSDLVAGQKYLMVDAEHAIVVAVEQRLTVLVATPEPSYLRGFDVVNMTTFDLAYINNSFVKFFQLPA